MKQSFSKNRFTTALYLTLLTIFLLLTLRHIEIPLLGSHPWRQADTLFTGYFFCNEDPSLLRPRIAQRGDTSGIAVGEFPLYSWLISIPCRLTGHWSESVPKIFSFFLFVASGLLFGVAAERRYRIDASMVALLFLCSELMVTFATRTLPDPLALFLFGLGGLVSTGRRYSSVFSIRNLIAVALVTLGFLIRPYMAPLALVFLRWGPLRLLLLGICIFLAYGRWYDEWIRTSELHYYLVSRKPLWEALIEFPSALWNFAFQTVKDHTNYVLLPFLMLGALSQFRLTLLWLGSFFLVAIVSGKHFATHSYYMFSAGTLALLIAALALQTASERAKKIVLTLFAIIGLANTQHYFHQPSNSDWRDTQTLVDSIAPYKTKITTLNPIGDEVPIWLYYAKRTGWSLFNNPANRARACSQGSTAVLIKTNESLTVEPCESL